MSDDFDETIDALSMSSNISETTHNQTPHTPQTQQTDVLSQQIMDKINEYDYPITAQFIAKKIGKTKSEVNSKLYKMKLNNQVEQLECIPPLWRVTV